MLLTNWQDSLNAVYFFRLVVVNKIVNSWAPEYRGGTVSPLSCTLLLLPVKGQGHSVIHGRGRTLEIDLVAPFQFQQFPRLIRRGNVEAEAVENLSRRLDLIGIRFGELTRPDPQ